MGYASRSDQADLLGHRSHEGKNDARVERAARTLDAVLLVGKLLSQEQRVKLAFFGLFRDLLVKRTRDVVGSLTVARHPSAEMNAQSVHKCCREDHREFPRSDNVEQ